MLAYVVVIERRPLGSIGLRRPSVRDGIAALAIAVVTVLGFDALYLLVFPVLHLTENAQIEKLTSAPGWWPAISVVRAGVSEEVLFRGYSIERLQASTGSRALAAAISLLVFTVAHIGPWGWSHVLVAAFGGAMLTLLYLWRRNLRANICAHCLIDALAMLSG